MCSSTEASVATTERRRAPFSWKRWRLKRASSRPASLGTSSGPAAQCLARSLCGMCSRKERKDEGHEDVQVGAVESEMGQARRRGARVVGTSKVADVVKHVSQEYSARLARHASI